MTDEEIRELAAAFAAYLRRFRPCFLQDRTVGHFDSSCRALLSDLPRKSVEPVALACGTAARTVQLFLAFASWDHDAARDTLQRHAASLLPDLPRDRLGTVGVIDETSCRKKGDKTPGVQRQHLGCVGKVDNGVVTVHVGVARGRFQGPLPGAAGRRPVPPEVLGRGPRPLRGGRHPRRGALPAQGGGSRSTGCRA